MQTGNEVPLGVSKMPHKWMLRDSVFQGKIDAWKKHKLTQERIYVTWRTLYEQEHDDSKSNSLTA